MLPSSEHAGTCCFTWILPLRALLGPCMPWYPQHLLVLQVPFGMKLGAPVSVGLYIGSSMVPDFIGNMLSATFFLSGTYAFMVSSFLRAICKPSAHVLTIVVICSTAPCPTESTSSSPR